MIRHRRAKEPAQFNSKCRLPGKQWLERTKSARSRPKDYWSAFQPDLCIAFRRLCAFQAINIGACGTVDHLEPTSSHPKLAYEWRNYRYCEARMNSRKNNRGSKEILDPFEVRDDWFEIILPSLQMKLTDRVPAEKQIRAQATLRLLGLDHHETVLRARSEILEAYLRGELTLKGLHAWAPLIASAVEREDWKPYAVVTSTS